MATGTAGTAAREFVSQQVHYLRKSIDYTMDGTTVDVGIIPAGSVVLPTLSGVVVSTAFNGGTTNTLDIGVAGDLERFASDLALGTAAHVPMDDETDLLAATDLTIQASVVSTASASAGSGEVIVAYIPDNDL